MLCLGLVSFFSSRFLSYFRYFYYGWVFVLGFLKVVMGIFLFFVSGEWLCLKVVVGYSGNGWVNMVWRLDIGFFVYMCGCLVVVEDLYFGV